MYRTLCVLALLAMQPGLAHCFSWDIVEAATNRLEFYNEGKFTYSVTFANVDVDWITYDPFHNRVLLTNNSRSLLSFDVATGEIQTLIDLKPRPDLNRFTYDPATGLFFVMSRCNVYSYHVTHEFNHQVDANFVIYIGNYCAEIAVDSCGGYIYWTYGDDTIERARLNGSDREEIIGSRSPFVISKRRHSLTIDLETQNMYWVEFDYTQYFILSADLNGNNKRTIRTLHVLPYYNPFRLSVSNDFIYWAESVSSMDNKFFWKIPKNLPIGTDVEAKQIAFKTITVSGYDRYITANYAIEEQPQGIPLCKALKRLLPNYSETNDSDSLNVSTGGSLLRVNETKVSGESQVSGDIWNVPVCQYYCLQGNCSVSADGQPKCRCNVGYSGVRCEVNACQTYCLHDGVCSLSEQNNPVCQCIAGYQGERCDVPAFLIKCSCSCSTVPLLKDILNADSTSVSESKGVKSTCASTVD